MGRQTSPPYSCFFYGLADQVREGLDMPLTLQEAFVEAVHVELVSAEERRENRDDEG